jgi:hypothetical protein
MRTTPYILIQNRTNKNINMKYSKKIISVYRTKCSNLSSLIYKNDSLVSNIDSSLWERLNIKVPADLTVTTKIEDKSLIYMTKLVFNTCGDRYSNNGHYAYKVTQANGEVKLIGDNSRPFPIALISESQTSSSDNELIEVTVSYSSTIDLPYMQ